MSAISTRHVISRIGAAVLGGYVFIWGFFAFTLAGGYGLGMEFHDAESLSSILSFLLYLTVFLWAFAASQVNRVWLLLISGGLLMTAAGALIQHSLV
jgi:hypothetical protein